MRIVFGKAQFAWIWGFCEPEIEIVVNPSSCDDVGCFCDSFLFVFIEKYGVVLLFVVVLCSLFLTS